MSRIIEGSWCEFPPIDYDTGAAQNESRADYGSRISGCTGDWGENELRTDITDALANVVHFIHRVGLDPKWLFNRALESAEGDLEDGPEARYDGRIKHAHDRMAGGHI